jgi:thioredoxin-like negative regulator of GroEL
VTRAALILISVLSLPAVFAQQLGRPQDGFYSGQSNGQVDPRVDGRASKNEGLPPSAADKNNRSFDNPISASDCAEVEALKPDARPGYQARVREACGE